MSLSVKNVDANGRIMWEKDCNVLKKFVVVGDGCISKEMRCKKWTSYDNIKQFVATNNLMEKIKEKEEKIEIEVF